MAVLPIRLYGDPVLREKAVAIAAVDAEVRTLAADMTETMYAANGLGLAGNQVGVARRILVIDVSQSEDRDSRGKKAAADRVPEVYLNTEILESSDDDGTYVEGCLSIPGLEGEVYRPLSIRVRWMDLDGKVSEETFDGLRARVLQHEIDHLDGVLFVDRLGAMRRRLMAGRLAALRQKTREQLGLPPSDGTE